MKAKPEEVYKYYRKALVAQGFKVQVENEIPFYTASGVGLGMFTASQGSREVNIGVVCEKPGASTNVMISYEEKLIREE